MLGKKVPKNQKQIDKNLNSKNDTQQYKLDQTKIKFANNTNNNPTKISNEIQTNFSANSAKANNSISKGTKSIKIENFESEEETYTKSIKCKVYSNSSDEEDKKNVKKKSKKNPNNNSLNEISEEETKFFKNEKNMNFKREEESNLLNKKKAREIDELLSDNSKKENSKSTDYLVRKKNKNKNKKQTTKEEIIEIKPKIEDEILFEKNKFYDFNEDESEKNKSIIDSDNEKSINRYRFIIIFLYYFESS